MKKLLKFFDLWLKIFLILEFIFPGLTPFCDVTTENVYLNNFCINDLANELIPLNLNLNRSKQLLTFLFLEELKENFRKFCGTGSETETLPETVIPGNYSLKQQSYSDHINILSWDLSKNNDISNTSPQNSYPAEYQYQNMDSEHHSTVPRLFVTANLCTKEQFFCVDTGANSCAMSLSIFSELPSEAIVSQDPDASNIVVIDASGNVEIVNI